MKTYSAIPLLAVLILLMMNGPAHSEFYLKWHVSGSVTSTFASQFGTNPASNGNVVREEAFGIMRDDSAPFIFIVDSNGPSSPGMLDLDLGIVHPITGLTTTPSPASYAANIRVRYFDMDNDGRDEVLLYMNNWGIACIDWNFTSGSDEMGDEATGAALIGNRPNPLSTNTTISFSLDSSSDINLSIYDVSGRLVRALVNGRLPSGIHRIPWNGLDDADHPLPSGTYFYRLRSDGLPTGTEKAVVLN